MGMEMDGGATHRCGRGSALIPPSAEVLCSEEGGQGRRGVVGPHTAMSTNVDALDVWHNVGVQPLPAAEASLAKVMIISGGQPHDHLGALACASHKSQVTSHSAGAAGRWMRQ